MRKIRWGILSTARIAIHKVIPAMQQGCYCSVVGIASRNADAARAVSEQLGIPKAYGSYEALLADPEIEAVYIPLPNHLHVPWSIRALDAGKHVLCEKPVGLNVAEAEQLFGEAMRHPKLKVMEAFMYRHHPQWQRARQMVAEGAIGGLRTIDSFFSYHNTDPDNIRNKADIGGGALLDIGCYCISLSRFLFCLEPLRVHGIIDYDPLFKIDRLASGIMDFGPGKTAIFTCGTQLAPFQRVNIIGTEGRIEIEIPFNAPPNQPCNMRYQRGDEIRQIALDTCNQYTIQGDLFSQAVLNDADVPTPLEDAVANMRVIEALIRSAKG